ncbi:MAG: LytTR family transcriptional regulator [Rhodanobacter sp. 68-29]|uniref:LytTR family DNA-binding domain-containing protein n=1 Tax=Rhodanobacter sp. PCA2 TaxID=2006117 RepID=UPI00086EB52A|nr:LytTR family DNA-binding domain-containing protein [Rhodanobacter sp. PCA2]MBA2080153.1 LytTR family transcriptional regulator [Rhodanobacter sp. PCA2]MBN8923087.1 LytTR family transcriptional regulator [Rhodanobacter sp.]ODU74859.1 MAG: LytTR family transcriptional regulator [Rhodanobacter sp. SCN 69-32]OJY58521.1 MAG: LytTR family transcriptional regulator [Rhodanobacter sp. 68-29]
MNEQAPAGCRDFQRWPRSVEIAFWVTLYTLNTIFNGIVARIDHARTAAWEPWVWESSSCLVVLLLIPFVKAAERRWPFRFDTWRHSLPWHLLASVVFSLVHVAGMDELRKLAYAMVGQHYDFGAWWPNFGYEYLKDIRSYFIIVAMICLSRLWLLRQQGEAKLLDEPDDGPPVEPVERPERFLVRKLGKEFLVNASEIEWLQAAGNYVNLHVRGRDYPLRSTMAGIETRLDPARFLRVHRGYFVNLDYLAEIEPLETGDARLRLRDGATIPCSRRYRAALRERYGQPAPAE